MQNLCKNSHAIALDAVRISAAVHIFMVVEYRCFYLRRNIPPLLYNLIGILRVLFHYFVFLVGQLSRFVENLRRNDKLSHVVKQTCHHKLFQRLRVHFQPESDDACDNCHIDRMGICISVKASEVSQVKGQRSFVQYLVHYFFRDTLAAVNVTVAHIKQALRAQLRGDYRLYLNVL